MNRLFPAFAGFASLALPSVASPGWVLRVDFGPGQSSVNPANPSCRVYVLAAFDAPDYALAGARLDLGASDGLWTNSQSNPRLQVPIVPPNGYHTNPLTGLVAGQLHFPPAGIFADPSNPFEIGWFLWEAQSFEPRLVDVGTATTRFDVYPLRTSPTSQSRLAGLIEGHAQIVVVPAPASAAFLGVGAAIIAPRRRRAGARTLG